MMHVLCAEHAPSSGGMSQCICDSVLSNDLDQLRRGYSNAPSTSALPSPQANEDKGRVLTIEQNSVTFLRFLSAESQA